MVTALATDGADRGQLLLVGAITVAFVVLGIVVVFNGVLYTQTTSSGHAIDDTGDVATSDREIRHGVRGVVWEVNRDGATGVLGTVTEAVLENELTGASGEIADYSQNYRLVKANSRDAIVDVSATNVVGWEYGRIVYEPGNNPFPNGDVYDAGSSGPTRTVGRFVVAINVSGSSFGDDFEVEVEDDGGSPASLEFDRNADGNLTVSDGASTCELAPRSDGTVEVNLLTGETKDYGNDCDPETLGIVNESAEYERITFVNGDEAVGAYELVVDGETGIGFAGTVDNSLAVWSLDVTYAYESATVSFTRDVTVSVYGGDR